MYAEVPSLRLRQLVADSLFVAWTLIWVRLATWVHDLVSALAVPGRLLEQGGERFATSLSAAGRQVADIPLAGSVLASPFGAAADAGRAVQQAGAAQQESVLMLALVLALIVGAFPITIVFAMYVPGRVRWIREAMAARRIRDSSDLTLFAMRALVHRPLRELHRVSSDPAAALRSGDHRELAALELRALGLGPG